MRKYFSEGCLTSYEITGFENDYALLAPSRVFVYYTASCILNAKEFFVP